MDSSIEIDRPEAAEEAPNDDQDADMAMNNSDDHNDNRDRDDNSMNDDNGFSTPRDDDHEDEVPPRLMITKMVRLYVECNVVMLMCSSKTWLQAQNASVCNCSIPFSFSPYPFTHNRSWKISNRMPASRRLDPFTNAFQPSSVRTGRESPTSLMLCSLFLENGPRSSVSTRCRNSSTRVTLSKTTHPNTLAFPSTFKRL